MAILIEPLKSGFLSKKYDTSQIWAKVPSQEFSISMVNAFKNRLKEDKGERNERDCAIGRK